MRKGLWRGEDKRTKCEKAEAKSPDHDIELYIFSHYYFNNNAKKRDINLLFPIYSKLLPKGLEINSQFELAKRTLDVFLFSQLKKNYRYGASTLNFSITQSSAESSSPNFSPLIDPLLLPPRIIF